MESQKVEKERKRMSLSVNHGGGSFMTWAFMPASVMGFLFLVDVLYDIYFWSINFWSGRILRMFPTKNIIMLKLCLSILPLKMPISYLMVTSLV